MKNKKAAPQGWCQAKVAFALNLDIDGGIKGIISLKREEERGKKTVWVPSLRTVPQMVSRSSG
ncbi:MAG: type I-C CRISPR-associated protein Cas8c/Csd1 [Phascolarctobacterium sp.]